ncbi:GntR family transcriptional regulator [Ovoidimarina sediminis]|uniref:GntR family transcriptional regulator n=1 Tax=Ovoidimarina sediminis TaxID=3079856 RepID=UPI00290D34AC|nr:GntR family transcriptional regulator [Rhodophyticola sp. MJ-SS7]MDU8943027.1 GntR family transcriptional regulator [Rhodophyticola sp. MJ-SS7]
MKLLKPQPSLTEQVYEAIVDEICDGALPAGSHLVQEQLAERLGVSRQPVQQAMARLKADGMVEEVGRRGLWVTRLDADLMRHHYDIRAALDGLAARMAAERIAAGPERGQQFTRAAAEILELGQRAVETGDVAGQVRHDMALHTLIYDASGNPLLARTAEPHWRFLRRAMSEVLRHATLPREIWRQHAEIVEAIAAGDAARADTLMVAHDLAAAETLRAALDVPAAEPANT